MPEKGARCVNRIQTLQRLHPYDIRLGHWVRFAEPRLVPVLAHGQMTCTVIAARHLHLEEVQRRISLETRINRYRQLIAVTHDVWIIIAHYLPTHIVDQLDELHELPQSVLRRGGVHGNSHDILHVRVNDGAYTQTNYCMEDTYSDVVDWILEEHAGLTFDYALVTCMVPKKKKVLSYHMCLGVHYDRTERADLCFTKRGGQPISTISWYAYSPYQEVEFVIEDENVVIAEFICNLAYQHGWSSDDIVVLTDTHVPMLHETLTTLFIKNEDLCVVLLDKLCVHDGAWMWSPQFITKAAGIQRGMSPTTT